MRTHVNSFRFAAFVLAASFVSCAFAANRTVLQPLRVSANGRYFETSAGEAWFWLGDTAWSLLTAYTPAEQKAYLAARAKMGFTLIQTVAVWDGGTGTEHGLKPNPNTAGIQPWRNHDPLQPNEAYWRNVDAMVAEAAKNNLYVGLLPSWGSFVVDYKMITMANAEAYGRWLGHRYRNAPNIVWIEGGDRDVIWTGPGSEKYSDSVNIWRAIARGLREGDGGIHPITFHPGGVLRNNQAEKWLAADMIQTWAWYKDIPKDIAADYSLAPPKPVILAEGAYEEGPEYPTRPITPLIVRRQAYWVYLSGGFFTYGHNDMWRKNPTWKKSLYSEGSQDMRVLHTLFAGVHWWNLCPDRGMFVSGEGSGATLNVAAISSRGDWAMVYFSSLGAATLRFDGLKDKRVNADQIRANAEWIDPRTGEYSNAPTCFKPKSEKTFQPPAGWPDAVLLIRPVICGDVIAKK